MCTRAVFSFTPLNADAFGKTSSRMINVVLMHIPLRVAESAAGKATFTDVTVMFVQIPFQPLCIEMANASIGKAIQRVLQLCADRPHCSPCC